MRPAFLVPFFPEKPARDSKKEKDFHAEMLGIEETMNQQLSHSDVEKMRELVLAHDRNNAKGQIIDLSKPILVPYSHKEFPKVVYNHAESEPGFWAIRKTTQGDDLYHVPAKLAQKTVNNPDELEAALAGGFQEDAPSLDDCNTQDDPYTGFGRPESKRKPGRPKAS